MSFEDGWHSFLPILECICDVRRPDRILEWGSGVSTYKLAQWCPYAEIVTVEHDIEYVRKMSEGMPENVTLFFTPLSDKPGEDAGYSVAPILHGYLAFDLIFIDGRRRLECLATAYTLISWGGIVVLHDSDRPMYRAGKELFQCMDVLPLRTSILYEAPIDDIIHSVDAYIERYSSMSH